MEAGGGRAARAAGGNACTGGRTDDQRRGQLMRSGLRLLWRRGAHARCSSAWCWSTSGHGISRSHEVRYPGEVVTPLGEKETPLGETLTVISAGPGAGPTQESLRQVRLHI